MIDYKAKNYLHARTCRQDHRLQNSFQAAGSLKALGDEDVSNYLNS